MTVIIGTKNLEHLSPDWWRNNLYLSSGKLWNIEDNSPRDFTLVSYNIFQKDYSKTLKLLKLTIIALGITGLRENAGY